MAPARLPAHRYVLSANSIASNGPISSRRESGQSLFHRPLNFQFAPDGFLGACPWRSPGPRPLAIISAYYVGGLVLKCINFWATWGKALCLWRETGRPTGAPRPSYVVHSTSRFDVPVPPSAPQLSSSARDTLPGWLRCRFGSRSRVVELPTTLDESDLFGSRHPRTRCGSSS